MQNDGYEIDFLAVGTGERSGDAIAMRIGDLMGHRDNQLVIVIDGGTKDSGSALVGHIKKYYSTDHVDMVISTHPDNDHISGLSEVMDSLSVSKLYMHQPWKHASKFIDLFKDGRITPNSLEERLERSLNQASDLEALAKKNAIEIIEPFSDYPMIANGLYILNPSKDFYESQIALFRSTPEPAVEQLSSSIIGQLLKGGAALIRKIAEKWDFETLKDPDEQGTSAENNSSVVLFAAVGQKKLLLTADAGVPALEQSNSKLISIGLDWNNLSFVQVPHHGSKHNVGPTVLNKILGPIRQEKEGIRSTFISCAPKGEPKHPAKKVVNAFTRRGCKVISTADGGKRSHYNAPKREGWVSVTPLPFYDEVDE